MSSRFVVPEDTLRDQARASDPRHSAWVSANAGSGKTHVLSQRVMRLLLDGTDPSRILCLTYTKAAAANMANRVFRELARWTTLADDELLHEIEKLQGRRPSPEKMRLARQLFARALETPGGLKIQTIHAFCEAVLHQFPLEANIAGHFEMLDGQMEVALVAEARRDLLTGISASGNPALAEAFASILQRGGETGLDLLLAEIVQKRDHLRAFIGELAGDTTPFQSLFTEFGFQPGDSAAAIAQSVWPDGYFCAEWAQDVLARGRAANRANTVDFATRLAEACATEDPILRLQKLRDVFLMKKNGSGWQARSPGNVVARAIAANLPGFADEFQRAATVILEASDRLALFRMLEATRAALTVADWLITRYERLKSARGFLDFNDLITRTAALLARQDAGPWVMYKLDKGIDHILVDEAQDTSPQQWNVVRALAAEFFSGQGAREEVRRTIFAVGDEKQSIYSFQGADPESFDVNGREFAGKIRAAGGGFERVPLTRSFRSTWDVLSAVDLTFAPEEVRKGLTRDPAPIEHTAIREAAPGYVEIWPALDPQEVEEPDDWTQPIDHATAPAVRLAEQIAGCIQHWLDSREVLEGRGKRLRPGDVMVLVRKRDSFVHALTRSLKNREIPVAGADRLNLRDHIAVKDLIALGRFVLQPEDDLSLAALLKSPIFGLSEEQLFSLAWKRGRNSLFQSIQKRAASDLFLAPVLEQLLHWRAEADFRPVFEFYGAILGRDGVRRKMIARLGNQAGEILDEFLNFCLAEERTGLPGLEAFLATLESASPEIKREMDQMRDEIRIMTVHAAKGLEAPVVFLVDSGSAPFSQSHLPRLLEFEPPDGGWQGKGYLWRASADLTNSFSRQAARRLSEKGEEEYRRLLYVGMTRAEDRLIVCGYRGKRPPKDPTWHSLVSQALQASPDCEELQHPAGGFACHRYRATKHFRAPAAGPEAQPVPGVRPIPQHLLAPLPPAPTLPRLLSPSAAGAAIEPRLEMVLASRSPVLDMDAEPSLAVARGTAIHRLLQMLPGLAVESRQAAALRYLDRIGAAWPQEERSRAWESVETVLADRAFGPVFGQGSRAEVPVMGTLEVNGKEWSVSGTIDRLAVTPTDILIVDYKTNRPPPAAVEEVPPAYVTQLALYRELLEPLYRGRTIRAALLFTEAPRLIELEEKLMDAALARLTAD